MWFVWILISYSILQAIKCINSKRKMKSISYSFAVNVYGTVFCHRLVDWTLRWPQNLFRSTTPSVLHDLCPPLARKAVSQRTDGSSHLSPVEQLQGPLPFSQGRRSTSRYIPEITLSPFSHTVSQLLSPFVMRSLLLPMTCEGYSVTLTSSPNSVSPTEFPYPTPLFYLVSVHFMLYCWQRTGQNPKKSSLSFSFSHGCLCIN